MTSCFLCKRPVLGLAGIEAHLDTFMWQKGLDAKPIDAGKFGYCHLACLSRDSAGAEWTTSLIAYFERSLRFVLCHKEESFGVFRGVRPDRFLMIWNNGVHYLLSPAEYHEYVLLRRRVVRQRSQRITIDSSPAFSAWLDKAIRREGGVLLEQVYREARVPFQATTFGGVMKAPRNDADFLSLDGRFDGEVEVAYSFEATEHPGK